MAIVIRGAAHAELNLVGKDKTSQTILPVNTADDVIVDNDMNTLSDVLPFIKDSTSVTGALDVSEVEEVADISDSLYTLLTTNETPVVDEEEEEDDEPEAVDPEDLV